VYRFKKVWHFGENVLKEWDGTEQVEKLYAITMELLGLKEAKSLAVSNAFEANDENEA